MKQEERLKLVMALEQAQGTKRKAEKVTEQLNARILQAEQALQELALGVQASVDFGMGYRLSYEKFSGEWRLVVRTIQSTEEPRLLLSCSRVLRIDGARSLSELVSRLCRAVESEMEFVHQAIVDTDKLVELLKGAL